MMYGLSSWKGEVVDVHGPIVTPKLTCAPISDRLTVISGVLTVVVVVAVESVLNVVESGTEICGRETHTKIFAGSGGI